MLVISVLIVGLVTAVVYAVRAIQWPKPEERAKAQRRDAEWERQAAEAQRQAYAAEVEAQRQAEAARQHAAEVAQQAREEAARRQAARERTRRATTGSAMTAMPADQPPTGEIDARGGSHMTKNTVRKAAFVFTKEEIGTGEAATVQLAVPVPREVGRWFRHYALDHGLSMAELIRQILRDFMAIHGGPAE